MRKLEESLQLVRRLEESLLMVRKLEKLTGGRKLSGSLQMMEVATQLAGGGAAACFVMMVLAMPLNWRRNSWWRNAAGAK